MGAFADDKSYQHSPCFGFFSNRSAFVFWRTGQRVVDGDALKVTGGVGTILVRRQQEEEVADRGQTGESKGLPGGR